jgi:glycosyltransferase involved in cell wall biosynthesis
MSSRRLGSPLVSVVMPAYNAQLTVAASVRTALAQEDVQLEVIVVDDGSSDDTAAVVEGIRDPRVRLVQQSNSGAAAARNTGLAAATGTYLALLDADDLWVPWKLRRQLDMLSANPGAAGVQSGSFFVDSSLRLLYPRPCFMSTEPLLDTLMFRNLSCTMSTLVLERDALERTGNFNVEYEILEEWDFMIKVARFAGLVSVPAPLCLYRVHPGNRSRDLDIHVSPGLLILDRLFSDDALPPELRAHEREIRARFLTMLAGGAFKIGRIGEAVQWARRAAVMHPKVIGYITAVPARRMRRRRGRAMDDREDEHSSYSDAYQAILGTGALDNGAGA